MPVPVLNTIEPRAFLTAGTSVRIQGANLGGISAIELEAGDKSMNITTGFVQSVDLQGLTFSLPDQLLNGE
jgi:hypothetical protein